MSDQPRGLGSLIFQPQYIPSSTWLARHAAPYFRPIIFVLVTLIVAETAFKHRHAPIIVPRTLVGSLAVYSAVFIWRMRMKKSVEHRFYHPHVQFFRGQISLLGVTLIIFVLATFGVYDHMLWLLYALATLLISEHNQTTTVILTLVEVAFLYFFATYLGWGLYTGEWLRGLAFWETNNSLGEHILGIWLVTIVFHYLVRNIHGRNRAYDQQQNWLNLATEKWASVGDPQEKRRAFIKQIEELTKGKAELWLPRLRDGVLRNEEGEIADPRIPEAASQAQPVIWLRSQMLVGKTIGSCLVREGSPVNEWASAQVIIPIRRSEKPHELLGVLTISCEQEQVSEYKLRTACDELMKMLGHIRLLLINSRQHEQQQLLWTLSIKLHHKLNVTEVAKQVADDVVQEFGFDFAAVSLVDDAENLIRCVADRNTMWGRNSIYPLSPQSGSKENIQSRTVREGISRFNDGKYSQYLDGKTWHQQQLWRYVRVWVPIPDPALTSPYPALGTIEGGFERSHQETIPQDLIHLLEQYACHVGLALANAEAHQRTQELAEELKTLQSLSQKMQHAAAYYEPYQMITLIGKSAEKLLKADIVMLYTLNEDTHELDLAYQTADAIRGYGQILISMYTRVMHQLYTDRTSYFSSNARQDPLLVNLKDGRLESGVRTFTQRQNIKSFAGVPLIGKREDVVGFLCINYRRRREFHHEFQEIIKLFAAQATVALEESYSHRLSRRIAIARERSHLKAELHHSLSQNLFGLTQYVNTACRYAEAGQTDMLLVNLGKLKATADQSQESLHDMLNALEEAPDGQISFIHELGDYIARMDLLHPHVDICFEYTSGEMVPSQVQFCLMRIVHEALNNALRHSQCRMVQIVYRVDAANGVELIIRDDGIGFNVIKARQNGRYGLGTMEYYAQQVNSSLTVNSHEGEGTRIQISVLPPPAGV
ncbi:MAG: GAF domain-containing protein [Chloroflexi bacterium]|nr:GAF domain-containing protein [Chloroflexota bacterium]